MMFQRRFIAFIFLLAMPPLGCHIPNEAPILNNGISRFGLAESC